MYSAARGRARSVAGVRRPGRCRPQPPPRPGARPRASRSPPPPRPCACRPPRVDATLERVPLNLSASRTWRRPARAAAPRCDRQARMHQQAALRVHALLAAAVAPGLNAADRAEPVLPAGDVGDRKTAGRILSASPETEQDWGCRVHSRARTASRQPSPATSLQPEPDEMTMPVQVASRASLTETGGLVATMSPHRRRSATPSSAHIQPKS